MIGKIGYSGTQKRACRAQRHASAQEQQRHADERQEPPEHRGRPFAIASKPSF